MYAQIGDSKHRPVDGAILDCRTFSGGRDEERAVVRTAERARRGLVYRNLDRRHLPAIRSHLKDTTLPPHRDPQRSVCIHRQPVGQPAFETEVDHHATAAKPFRGDVALERVDLVLHGMTLTRP